ncbi:MAG TPA: cysteine desulfurase [Firmicutes bacterium]|nr:cysteine desulfurase [Bacillota bacterium]
MFVNVDKFFPMKKEELIYFDNAATTFKPIQVINKEIEYMSMYTANSHRGDYNISFKVDDEIDNTRELVKSFINARHKEEIIFTSNTTDSLNLVVNGYFKNYLCSNDEVILNKAEHASNILPWLMLKKSIGFKIKYAALDKDNTLSLDSIKKCITKNTKVISLAYITNVIGDKRNIKEIVSYAHKHGIIVVVDAAQAIGHIKIDVRDMDADMLAFSAHKMCGPTGVGVLYAKKELLDKMLPVNFGGGMNLNYHESDISLAEIPYRFEAGTPNISGIISFGEAIKFLNMVGLDNIERIEKHLRKYLINELKKIDYVKVYNEDILSSIVLINIDGITSGDLGLYLNTHGICVRSGKHCTKMLKDESGFTDTVRISLYFYNSYEEIDKLVEALMDYKAIMEFVNK